MMLLKFILRTCRGMMVATTALALLSGACNTWLIWGFVALGLGKIVTNFASSAMLASFSQGAIAELRRDLMRKMLAVPLRNLEEIGTHRILVALTDDVFNIAQALLAIPVVSVNVAILIGGAVYLGML